MENYSMPNRRTRLAPRSQALYARCGRLKCLCRRASIPARPGATVRIQCFSGCGVRLPAAVKCGPPDAGFAAIVRLLYSDENVIRTRVGLANKDSLRKAGLLRPRIDSDHRLPCLPKCFKLR